MRADAGQSSKDAAERLRREPTLAPARFLARRGARYLVVPAAEALAFSFEDGSPGS